MLVCDYGQLNLYHTTDSDPALGAVPCKTLPTCKLILYLHL